MNQAIKPPNSDTAQAIAFLEAAHPRGPWHLVAMGPKGDTPESRTFGADQVEAMAAWIDERQGVMNLYWHVNQLLASVAHKKAKKEDVHAAAFLHSDIDRLDDELLGRLMALEPRPTVTIMSGGGYQIFYKLADPTTDLDDVESRNKALARTLGGDNCHNIDRIMRLPGTVNMPNQKKMAAGRVPTLAYVVEADWTRVYTPDRFPLAAAAPAKKEPATDVLRAWQIDPVGLDALPDTVTPEIRALLQRGDDPERPMNGENPRYPSRSEAVFRAAAALTRAKCPLEVVAGILINPALGISASVLEKRYPKVHALKQARAAKEAVDGAWPDVTRSGQPRPTMRNAVLALRKLELAFSYDRFNYRKMVEGRVVEDVDGEVSDDICVALRALVIEEFDFDPGAENVRDAVSQLCIQNSFHPVRQMLDALAWDGVPRLDHILVRYFGAEDTPFIRKVGAITLIAAVRRVRQPGVKFDQALILEGPQGSGKSSALEILAGPKFHSDQEILTLDTQGQMQMLEGVWLYEISEILGFRKAEIEKTKAFLSRRVDRSRMSYGRFKESRPRQVIFIGTTNESRYLRDPTGNRRFWPVKTGVIDLDALRRDRDQLLAEAAHREAGGESIILPEELWATAAAEQAERMEEDPWEAALAKVEGTAAGEIVRVPTNELLTRWLEIPLGHQTQNDMKRARAVMEQLGWQPAKWKDRGKTVRGYVRPKPDVHRNDPKLKRKKALPSLGLAGSNKEPKF